LSSDLQTKTIRILNYSVKNFITQAFALHCSKSYICAETEKINRQHGKDCLDPPYESGGTPAGSRFLLQTHKFERPENDIALPAC
jgi:hypothetical protein